jgi:hypothetical protein
MKGILYIYIFEPRINANKRGFASRRAPDGSGQAPDRLRLRSVQLGTEFKDKNGLTGGVRLWRERKEGEQVSRRPLARKVNR